MLIYVENLKGFKILQNKYKIFENISEKFYKFLVVLFLGINHIKQFNIFNLSNDLASVTCFGF